MGTHSQGHTHALACTHMLRHTCTYARTHTHACVHTSRHVCTQTQNIRMHAHTHIEKNTHTHTRTFFPFQISGVTVSIHQQTLEFLGHPHSPLMQPWVSIPPCCLAPSSAPLCRASSTPKLTTTRGERSCQHPKSACEKAASPLPAFKSTTPLHPHRTSLLRPITDKQVTPPHHQAVSLHPHLPSTWEFPSQKLILT